MRYDLTIEAMEWSYSRLSAFEDALIYGSNGTSMKYQVSRSSSLNMEA